MSENKGLCKTCGAEIRPNALFCWRCGQSLPVENKCPSCGKLIPHAVNFCVYCGTKLHNDDAHSDTNNEAERVSVLPKEPPEAMGSLLLKESATPSASPEPVKPVMDKAAAETATEAISELPLVTNKPHSHKKGWLIAIAALLVVAASLWGLSYTPLGRHVIDSYHISSANHCVHSDIDAALQHIEKIQSKDERREEIEAVYYEIGKEAQALGDYDSALVYFTNANGYNDSSLQIGSCYYEKGVAAKATEDYMPAIDYFTKAEGFSDSTRRIKECNYAVGLIKQEAGQYSSAISYFENAGHYKDSVNKVAECKAEEKYGVSLPTEMRVDSGYEKYSVSSIYAKKVSDGVQFTIFYSVPASCRYSVFSPPNGEHFMKTGTLSPSQTMFQVIIGTDPLLSDSFMTIKFYNGNGNNAMWAAVGDRDYQVIKDIINDK